MSGDFQWRLLLPASIRTLPADLVAVTALALATVVVVFAPVLSETPLRVVLGLPFVLFVPGYALVAALFPEAGDSPTEGDPADESAAGESARTGIDGIERVALSFGLSIAVVPLLGLALNFTPFGIRLVPILVTMTGFTLGMVAVAAHRRRKIPEDERFRVPYRGWASAAWTELTDPDSRLDGALNVLLVASILLATASVAYAVAVPKQGEAFTESYLLTERENGTLVADDYPTEFTAGEPERLIVGVGNHEHGTQTYEMVVEIQRVEIVNNSTRVLADEELRRFTTTLADGEDSRTNVSLAPEMTGDRLRLAFLLYRGDAPSDATYESAYRSTHLWVNVTAPGSAANRVAIG